MWDRAELKERGKAAFKANFWTVVVVAFILSIALGGLRFTQEINTVQNVSDSYSYGEATRVATRVSSWSTLALLLKVLALNPIAAGCYRFFLLNTKGQGQIEDVFWFFREGRWSNAVIVLLVRDVYLILWTLLFIIPGIVKIFSYRMVPFILAENPGLGPNEVITRSREMMDGQKGAAFVLDLSFIGWVLLSVLTLGILAVLYVSPWMECTNAELYCAIAHPRAAGPFGARDPGDYRGGNMPY